MISTLAVILRLVFLYPLDPTTGLEEIRSCLVFLMNHGFINKQEVFIWGGWSETAGKKL